MVSIKGLKCDYESFKQTNKNKNFIFEVVFILDLGQN